MSRPSGGRRPAPGSRAGGASRDGGLADRLVAATFGAILGAGLGFVIAWLLAGGSAWVPAGDFTPSFKAWSLGTGLGFALVGLALGSRASELLGSAISALWHVEAYAYWWYWPWRIAVVAILAGLGLGVARLVFG